MARQQIEFIPDQPVDLVLKYAEGRRYGERALFTTTDERVFYVDDHVARRIEAEVGKGEPFRLSYTKTRQGGRDWNIETAASEPARNGKLRIAAQPPLSDISETVPPLTPVASRLLASYLVAVDTLLEARTYAQRKGLVLAITCEDVRCLAATVFIDSR